MTQPVIAIVGGADPQGVYEVPVPEPEKAQEAARELGAALERAGFHMAVYSSQPRFIERYFVQGYLESDTAAEGCVQVHFPDGHGDYEEFPRYKERPQFFSRDPSHEPVWEVSFYRSIHKADGVILIGGGSSTRVAGLLAIADGKPLLSIAAFGGSAARVWQYLAGRQDQIAVDHIATPRQRTLMGAPWTPQSAQELVKCLEEQVAQYLELKQKARLEEDITKDKRDGLRIAWMSDLHVTCGPATWWRALYYIRGSRLTRTFARTNLTTILQRIEQIKPHHILVTGDLTTYADNEEFSQVRELFKNTQRMILGGLLCDLKPELWTILPGNHDVTWTNRAKGQRRNLGAFFKCFASLFQAGPNYDGAFPFRKTLPARVLRGIRVRLVGMDSTRPSPVWLIGQNARGRLDRDQFNRLDAQLNDREDGEIILVALHHHPVVVPHIVSETEERCLSLRENDGKNLIKLCAKMGVAAILHGHFHEFSHWLWSRQEGRQMAVLGSPCGTRDDPGKNVAFLELREAYQESRWGPRDGLALYRHTLEEQRAKPTWKEQYITFID